MNEAQNRVSLRPWAVEWTPASSAAYTPDFWKEWWNRATIRWDHAVLAWEEYDRPFLEHTNTDERILEAGCGSCGVVKFLEDHGRRFVVGLDFSLDTLRAVRRQAPAMKLVVGDCRRLPFRRGAFDCVMSLGVVEHFTEGPERLLEEMRAVMADDGRLVFTVPYLNPLEHLSQKLDDRKRPGPGRAFYQYVFRVGEARSLLTAAGFRVRHFAFCNRLGVFYNYFNRLRGFLRRGGAPDAAAARTHAAESPAPAEGLRKRAWILSLSRFIPGALSAMMILFVCGKERPVTPS